jgi:hypothetical protein
MKAFLSIFILACSFSYVKAGPASEPFIQKWSIGEVSSRRGNAACLQIAQAGYEYLKISFQSEEEDVVRNTCRTQISKSREAVMGCDNAASVGAFNVETGNYIIGRKGFTGFEVRNEKGQRELLSISGIVFRWFRTGNFEKDTGLFVIRGVEEKADRMDTGRNLAKTKYICEIRAPIVYKKL